MAAAGGAVLAASFARPGLAPAGWIGLAPVMILGITAPRPLRAAAEGFVFAAALHALSFAWWYGLLREFGRLSSLQASGVFLLLTIYVALYGALFGAGLERLARRRGTRAALATAPALWAALELIRGRAFTGLPWPVLGAGQQRFTAAIQVAELAGVTGVTLVVAAGNAALAWLILSRFRRGAGPGAFRMRGAAALVLVPAAALLYGTARLGAGWGGESSVTVGVVQGNVPQDVKWEPSARMRILEDHLEATREAAGRGAKLVVWAESSVPLPITSDPGTMMMLEATTRRLDIDLLVGSVHYERGGAGRKIFNSAFLIPGREPGREPLRYDKMHLVPFGEYVPFSSWLGPVESMVEEAGDFSAGEAPAVFDSRSGRLGPFICFEAIFPELVRRISASGAQVLVNLTNDAMLGDTAGPRQHLALAALRAVESRRWMVRAANTGISAVVDPAGRVVDSAPFGRRAVLVSRVPLLEGTTVYAAVGDVAGWGCAIFAALALFIPPHFPGRRRT